MEPIMFILFALIFVGIFAFSWYRKKKRDEAWQKAADRMGFRFDPGGFGSQMKITGRRRGKNVVLRQRKETSGSGKNRSTTYYNSASVHLDADCWDGFTIKSHGILDHVAKFFGGQDVPTGDDSFDDDFRIKGEINAEASRHLKDLDVQNALRALAANHRNFKLEWGMLQYETVGFITTHMEVIQLIEHGVDCAQVLDDAAGADAEAPKSPKEAAAEFAGDDDHHLDDWFPDVDDSAPSESADSPASAEPAPESSTEVW